MKAPQQALAEFAPVDLRSFEAGEPPLIDLYHLVRGRLVLYCEADAVFTEQARKNLLDNGVATLYARLRSSKPAAIGRSLSRFLSLPDSQVPPLVKASLLYSSAVNATRGVLDNPGSPEHQQAAQQLIGMTVAHLLRSAEIFYALLQMMHRDYSVYTHSVNVSAYAVALGIKLGLSLSDLLELGFGALLHDTGKTRVPLEILNKPGPLTGEERAVVQQHPAWGIQTLGASLGKRPLARSVVLHHHERLDGSGYPDGLVGQAIPPFVRVAGMADVYDALTSQRPYRAPMHPFDALCLMKTTMNRQLDGAHFSCFVELLGGRISGTETAVLASGTSSKPLH